MKIKYKGQVKDVLFIYANKLVKDGRAEVVPSSKAKKENAGTVKKVDKQKKEEE